METVPFTKAEMQAQLSTALLFFVRSTSWVLDFDASYRLMGWPQKATDAALTHVDLEDFAEVAKEEGQTLDLSRFSVVGTFDALYDYGVLGILQSPIFPIANATEATFAMAFVFDCQRSELLFEMQGGGTVNVTRCIHTAEVAMARQVLGGGDRALIGSDNKPDKLLTMREVALLANMEERSVRNAASGKSRPDLLKTTILDGDRFVAPEDALEWLKDRRGFNQTQRKGHLVDFDISSRAFDGAWEAADFIRQRLAAADLPPERVAQTLGLDMKTGDLEPRLRDLGFLSDPGTTLRLAELIGVNGNLLALRLNECRTNEQLQSLRRSIATLRDRSAP
jgi:hypothetical protein